MGNFEKDRISEVLMKRKMLKLPSLFRPIFVEQKLRVNLPTLFKPKMAKFGENRKFTLTG